MNTIARTINFTIGGHVGNHNAEFSWHPADPLVVKATFQWGDVLDVADWGFSRELLLEGLDAILNVGQGDVKVRSDAYQYVMTLSSPDGHGQVFIPRWQMVDFLAATTSALPVDSVGEEERMDAWLDVALNEILSEEI